MQSGEATVIALFAVLCTRSKLKTTFRCKMRVIFYHKIRQRTNIFGSLPCEHVCIKNHSWWWKVMQDYFLFHVGNFYFLQKLVNNFNHDWLVKPLCTTLDFTCRSHLVNAQRYNLHRLTCKTPWSLIFSFNLVNNLYVFVLPSLRALETNCSPPFIAQCWN